MNSHQIRWLAVLAGAASVSALISTGGCKDARPTAPAAIAPAATAAAVEFVGSTVCGQCHKAEFDSESHSHHAQTMRAADSRSLGSLAPPVGSIAGTAYSIVKADDGFEFKSSGEGAGSAKIEYALGSGITNLTFVGKLDKVNLTEFRLSYNPSKKKWLITPGQEASDDLELGSVHPPGVAKKCILCHADALETAVNVPAAKSIGVGCESCHGAGARHVAAMQHAYASPANLEIKNPGKLSAHEINSSCGVCHRTIDAIPLKGLEAVSTARFQPYGLEISPCYRKSGGAISCITCHDPHTDASRDAGHYEKACLSCHVPGGASGGKPNKPCPINAKSGCIPCHMPQQRVLPETKIPLTMTDHLIWAYRPDHKSNSSPSAPIKK